MIREQKSDESQREAEYDQQTNRESTTMVER